MIAGRITCLWCGEPIKDGETCYVCDEGYYCKPCLDFEARDILEWELNLKRIELDTRPEKEGDDR